MRCSKRLSSMSSFQKTRAMANDLKLSEPRGWRDRCVVGKGGGRKQRA